MNPKFRWFGVLILGLVLLAGSAAVQTQDDPLIPITILHTSDEHGWLHPFTPSGSVESRGGAANIYGWWVTYEDYDPDTMLLLSGGDSWTGQAVSTLLYGRPTVDVFNGVGYDAVTIGNHEFDFGRDVLLERIAESDYPYLSANIRYAETGALVEFAQPYVIQQVNGVQVGIIGLTTTATAGIVHPKHISDLVFTDYASAMDEFVPQMRAEGAEVVLLLAHVCPSDLYTLARRIQGTPAQVDAMFAGHCHQLSAREVAGIPILSSGEHWSAYTRLTLLYDPASGEIVSTDYATVDVFYNINNDNPVVPDADVQQRVDYWQAETGSVLSSEIGYTEHGLPQRSPAMVNWILDSWLWAFPGVDIAMSNWGGFRQDLPAGSITANDIINILPFDNTLVIVEITGQQLAENLRCCGGAVAGMTYSRAGTAMRLTDGSALDESATYRVIVNDYMYNGGDGYLFDTQDPDGYDTGVNWRQPIIDYTLVFRTTPENPLDDYFDFDSRTD